MKIFFENSFRTLFVVFLKLVIFLFGQSIYTSLSYVKIFYLTKLLLKMISRITHHASRITPSLAFALSPSPAFE